VAGDSRPYVYPAQMLERPGQGQSEALKRRLRKEIIPQESRSRRRFSTVKSRYLCLILASAPVSHSAARPRLLGDTGLGTYVSLIPRS